jgi:hypothetical protein
MNYKAIIDKIINETTYLFLIERTGSEITRVRTIHMYQGKPLLCEMAPSVLSLCADIRIGQIASTAEDISRKEAIRFVEKTLDGYGNNCVSVVTNTDGKNKIIYTYLQPPSDADIVTLANIAAYSGFITQAESPTLSHEDRQCGNWCIEQNEIFYKTDNGFKSTGVVLPTITTKQDAIAYKQTVKDESVPDQIAALARAAVTPTERLVNAIKVRMLKERLKNSEQYKDFTFLTLPVPFKELMLNENFDIVQTHCIQPVGSNDIIGFCGAFSWKDNVLTSLDSDTYSEDSLVYGYMRFTTECDETALDILID